jgi:hypothetical protein
MATLSATHTPGPWRYFDVTPLDTEGQYTGLRYVVMQDNENENVWICRTVDAAQTAEANARLIAAAPDLLETLRDLCDALTPGGNQDAVPEIYLRALNAIARAEGIDRVMA